MEFANIPVVKVYYGKPILPDVSRVLACLYEKNFELLTVQNVSSMPADLIKLQASTSVPTPFFEDGSKFLFDSRAICRYLSEAYAEKGNRFLLGRDLLDRVSIEQWLKSEEQSFDPPSRALVLHLAFPPNGSHWYNHLEEETERLAKVLDVYNHRLGESRYLAGDEFTLADLTHLPNSEYIASSEEWGHLYEERENVKRWWDEVSTRPSWNKVVDELIRSQEEDDDEEEEEENYFRIRNTTPKTSLKASIFQQIPEVKPVPKPASKSVRPKTSFYVSKNVAGPKGSVQVTMPSGDISPASVVRSVNQGDKINKILSDPTKISPRSTQPVTDAKISMEGSSFPPDGTQIPHTDKTGTYNTSKEITNTEYTGETSTENTGTEKTGKITTEPVKSRTEVTKVQSQTTKPIIISPQTGRQPSQIVKIGKHTTEDESTTYKTRDLPTNDRSQIRYRDEYKKDEISSRDSGRGKKPFREEDEISTVDSGRGKKPYQEEEDEIPTIDSNRGRKLYREEEDEDDISTIDSNRGKKPYREEDEISIIDSNRGKKSFREEDEISSTRSYQGKKPFREKDEISTTNSNRVKKPFREEDGILSTRFNQDKNPFREEDDISTIDSNRGKKTFRKEDEISSTRSNRGMKPFREEDEISTFDSNQDKKTFREEDEISSTRSNRDKKPFQEENDISTIDSNRGKKPFHEEDEISSTRFNQGKKPFREEDEILSTRFNQDKKPFREEDDISTIDSNRGKKTFREEDEISSTRSNRGKTPFREEDEISTVASNRDKKLFREEDEISSTRSYQGKKPFREEDEISTIGSNRGKKPYREEDEISTIDSNRGMKPSREEEEKELNEKAFLESKHREWDKQSQSLKMAEDFPVSQDKTAEASQPTQKIRPSTNGQEDPRGPTFSPRSPFSTADKPKSETEKTGGRAPRTDQKSTVKNEQTVTPRTEQSRSPSEQKYRADRNTHEPTIISPEIVEPVNDAKVRWEESKFASPKGTQIPQTNRTGTEKIGTVKTGIEETHETTNSEPTKVPFKPTKPSRDETTRDVPQTRGLDEKIKDETAFIDTKREKELSRDEDGKEFMEAKRKELGGQSENLGMSREFRTDKPVSPTLEGKTAKDISEEIHSSRIDRRISRDEHTFVPQTEKTRIPQTEQTITQQTNQIFTPQTEHKSTIQNEQTGFPSEPKLRGDRNTREATNISSQIVEPVAEAKVTREKTDTLKNGIEETGETTKEAVERSTTEPTKGPFKPTKLSRDEITRDVPRTRGIDENKNDETAFGDSNRDKKPSRYEDGKEFLETKSKEWGVQSRNLEMSQEFRNDIPDPTSEGKTAKDISQSEDRRSSPIDKTSQTRIPRTEQTITPQIEQTGTTQTNQKSTIRNEQTVIHQTEHIGSPSEPKLRGDRNTRETTNISSQIVEPAAEAKVTREKTDTFKNGIEEMGETTKGAVERSTTDPTKGPFKPTKPSRDEITRDVPRTRGLDENKNDETAFGDSNRDKKPSRYEDGKEFLEAKSKEWGVQSRNLEMSQEFRNDIPDPTSEGKTAKDISQSEDRRSSPIDKTSQTRIPRTEQTITSQIEQTGTTQTNQKSTVRNEQTVNHQTEHIGLPSEPKFRGDRNTREATNISSQIVEPAAEAKVTREKTDTLKNGIEETGETTKGAVERSTTDLTKGPFKPTKPSRDEITRDVPRTRGIDENKNDETAFGDSNRDKKPSRYEDGKEFLETKSKEWGVQSRNLEMSQEFRNDIPDPTSEGKTAKDISQSEDRRSSPIDKTSQTRIPRTEQTITPQIEQTGTTQTNQKSTIRNEQTVIHQTEHIGSPSEPKLRGDRNTRETTNISSQIVEPAAEAKVTREKTDTFKNGIEEMGETTKGAVERSTTDPTKGPFKPTKPSRDEITRDVPRTRGLDENKNDETAFGDSNRDKELSRYEDGKEFLEAKSKEWGVQSRNLEMSQEFRNDIPDPTSEGKTAKDISQSEDRRSSPIDQTSQTRIPRTEQTITPQIEQTGTTQTNQKSTIRNEQTVNHQTEHNGTPAEPKFRGDRNTREATNISSQIIEPAAEAKVTREKTDTLKNGIEETGESTKGTVERSTTEPTKGPFKPTKPSRDEITRDVPRTRGLDENKNDETAFGDSNRDQKPSRYEDGKEFLEAKSKEWGVQSRNLETSQEFRNDIPDPTSEGKTAKDISQSEDRRSSPIDQTSQTRIPRTEQTITPQIEQTGTTQTNQKSTIRNEQTVNHQTEHNGTPAEPKFRGDRNTREATNISSQIIEPAAEAKVTREKTDTLKNGIEETGESTKGAVERSTTEPTKGPFKPTKPSRDEITRDVPRTRGIDENKNDETAFGDSNRDQKPSPYEDGKEFLEAKRKEWSVQSRNLEMSQEFRNDIPDPTSEGKTAKDISQSEERRSSPIDQTTQTRIPLEKTDTTKDQPDSRDE